MAYSEKGFGARTANAEALLTYLKNFPDYAPPSADLSIASLEALIYTIKQHNYITTDAIEQYSVVVDIRERMFNEGAGSLIKLLSPINAACVATFGKSSKQLDSIMTLTRKIRGTRLKKANKNPDAESISESQRSYGSMTRALADLIIILDRYGDKYNPSNKTIEVAALQQLHKKLEEANKDVAISLGTQTKSRYQRAKNYTDLNKMTQRIKEAVKSQYAFSSTEYKLVRALVI